MMAATCMAFWSSSNRAVRVIRCLSTARVCHNDVKFRGLSTDAEAAPVPTKEVGKESGKQASSGPEKLVAPNSFRFVYPEFMPDPNMEWRNKMREKLERMDMLRRRSQIEIPEFYVGSILGVTVSDPHSIGKTNRFVGICIQRGGCGLRAWFTLRNVVEHQGVEVNYEMYNPTLQGIQVLRLEKRLDEHLLYLRDALPECSTFPLDMEPEVHPEGAPIPINPIKVKLKPRPWLERWERQELQGVQDLGLPERFYKRAKEVAKPWEKFDLMKQYRSTIPEEEQNEVYADIHLQLQELEQMRRRVKRKRTLTKPRKTN